MSYVKRNLLPLTKTLPKIIVKADMKKEKKNTKALQEGDIILGTIYPGRKNTDQQSGSPAIPKWIQQLRDLSPEDKKSLQEKIRNSLEESNSGNTE